MKPFLHSIGLAVPGHRIPQHQHQLILQSANGLTREEKLKLHAVYSNSGIEHRHSVLSEFAFEDNDANVLFHPAGKHEPLTVAARMELYDRYAADLCAEAAGKCLQQAAWVTRKEITHLVTFSCTGMRAPGLEIQLIEKLDLPRSINRLAVNFMGCYAGIIAMKTARQILLGQPDAVVLIAGVELCTLHYRKNKTSDQLIANALFADGAAAALLSNNFIQNDPAKATLKIINDYAEVHPGASNEMTWSIGDQGFDIRLSSEVPGVVEKNFKSFFESACEKAHIDKSEVSYFAIHPGGIKIIEACEQALALGKHQVRSSYEVLRSYGNMSSVTIFFVLDHLRSTAIIPGDKIFACAFGPGLTMESMLFES